MGAHVSAMQHYLTFAPESNNASATRSGDATPRQISERVAPLDQSCGGPGAFGDAGLFRGFSTGRAQKPQRDGRFRLTPRRSKTRAALAAPNAPGASARRHGAQRAVSAFFAAFRPCCRRAVFLRPGFGCGRSPGAFKDAGLFRAQSALPGTDEKRRPQHATAVSSAIPFPWCSAGGTRHAEPSSPPASPGIRLFPSDTPRTRPCPSDARTS